jgi:putative endopeptidase
MKKNFIYLTVVFTMILSTCNDKKKDAEPGVNLANRDTTALPGNDFYRYATGGWQTSHPLKPEHARFGTFDELREKSLERVRILVEELNAKTNETGSARQKMVDLYSLTMDSVRLNTEGASPLLPYLAK